MGNKMLRGKLDELAAAQNLSELFRDTVENRFRIPAFQREYAWKEGQIEDLFSDFRTFYSEADSDDLYLMGQIILADAEHPLYRHDLVDGQQRLTSLTLFLFAFRKFFRKHSAEGQLLHKDPYAKAVIRQIRNFLTFTEDNQEHPRILVQLGAQATYRAFLFEDDVPRDTENSAQNIWRNAKSLETKLAMEFDSDPHAALDFYRFVVDRVAVIKVKLHQDDEAIDFFEKMNDRGLRLSATDLMKNLLFSQFSNDAYRFAQTHWDDSIRALGKLDKTLPRTMAFLLKALLTKHTKQSVPASKVYREWKSLVKNSENAQEFFADVKSATAFLEQTSSGQVPAGEAIAASRYLGAKQFWTLILAARGYGADVAGKIASFVNARTVLSLLAEERSQDYERLVSPWANEIGELGRKNGVDASFEDFLQLEHSKVAQDTGLRLLELLDVQLKLLTYAADGPRVRLVLALAASEMENVLDSDLAAQPLSTFITSDAYDIDHIFPRALVGKSNGDLDTEERVDYLGNLALLHNKENRSAGKKPPSEKVDKYFNSSLALSRSLSWRAEASAEAIGGKKIRASEQKKDPRQLQAWDSTAIRARTELYASLLHRNLRRNMHLSLDEV